MCIIFLCKYLMLQCEQLWLSATYKCTFFGEKITSWCGLYLGALNSFEITIFLFLKFEVDSIIFFLTIIVQPI